MANRLAEETSPYLLQHRENPVDWRPWGSEALAAARELDRPLLISIGYSACHWCHVMERESFEDEDTAKLMNERYICVKVDREERPDVDDLYMESVQQMTGQGGWPLTVFADPEGVPFYGGTYFPPEPRHGMPSFAQVLDAVAEAWTSRRDELDAASQQVRDGLGAIGKMKPPPGDPAPGDLEGAISSLEDSADPVNGGFGGAPKFPPASAIELLMARGRLDHVRVTLDKMMRGGIYDQIGGGFARYSVDAIWLVPHFEKMLYDNALLARTYLHGWQLTGIEPWREICCETLDWALREMRGDEGGFASALDADSEGVEGRFYVWSRDELMSVLESAGIKGEEAATLADWWGVTEVGNFEGANILHVTADPGAEPPAALEAGRAALLEHRSKRVWPGLDDKRLCSWNALMISALADAGAALGRADYLDAARDCASFLDERMRDEAGTLMRTWKEDRASIPAFLEDHAYTVEAMLRLYEATFEPRWFELARATAETMIERFGDPENGGFFTAAADGEQLIARRKDAGDHPIPSGNSSAALGLLRLAALTGDDRYADEARRTVRLFHKAALRHPEAFGHLLAAIDLSLSPPSEVALVWPEAEQGPGELAPAVRAQHLPRVVLAGGPEGSEVPPLLAGRTAVEGAPAAYVCRDFACRAPTTVPDELAAALRDSPAGQAS